MVSIPFLARFAEKTQVTPVCGRYNRKTQVRVTVESGNVMATQPTHVETGTGGHNDTDTDAVED
jgi:hypothetical protein